jgi:amidase
VFHDYIEYDGLGLAALIASGQVSAREVADAVLRRIEVLDPALNAVIRAMPQEARAQLEAGLPAGPLAGVPMLLKDIHQDYAGVPTSAACRAVRRIPERHSDYVSRVLDAGLVVLGKTNLSELALEATTEPELGGPTHNPYRRGVSVGGSSGGSGAAVAARYVPIAGANDGGGSIRHPASCCGVFGLRPSRGLVSQGPLQGEVWEGASSEHVLTRSVRDSAAMLDVLAAPDAGLGFRVERSSGSYLASLQRPIGPLRVAFWTESPIGTPVDPACVRAVQESARLLASLGHHVEEAKPEVDGKAVADAFVKLYFGHVAAATAELVAHGARPSDFELPTRGLAMLGRALQSGEYVASHRRWATFARQLNLFFERYDVFMTPVMAIPPPPHGTMAMPAWKRWALTPLVALDMGKTLFWSGMVDQMAEESLGRTPFTQLANLTGSPAMSVPLGKTDDGLPVGTHFIARWGSDEMLFRLARQLEEAVPWDVARPPAPFGTALVA